MAHILSLDDCREFGQLIELILTHAGYRCTTTDDSFEAWALLQTVPFDLFTQDTSRPDVDGRLFHSMLRADLRFDDLPVVMITARSRANDKTWAASAGVDGYLTKPFGPRELVQLIGDILRAWHIPRQDDAVVWGERKLRPKAPEPAEAMIARLQDDRSEVRFWAARSLGLRGDPQAIDSLLRALDDRDEGVRWASALALGRLKAAAAVPRLAEALRSPSPLVRLMAAHALEKIGDAWAVYPLLRALEETHEEDLLMTLCLTRALAETSSPEAVPALTDRLYDTMPALRLEAAIALGRLGKPGMDALMAHTDVDDPELRLAVIRILSWCQEGDDVIESLLAALEDDYKKVRRAAAQALGWSLDSEILDYLLRLLRDPDPDVAKAAIHAMGRPEGTRAIDPLVEIFRDQSHPLRRDAVWALAQIGGRAWDLLAAELRDRDAVGRRILIDAIVYIGETRGCRLLATALRDPDVEVRRRAVYALEWCDMPEAIPPLIAALRDADPDVAANAASVLKIKHCREALPELRWVADHDMRRTRGGSTVAAGARQAIRAIEGG